MLGHYCNAGVVLFNLAKMREEGLSAQQFMDYCQKLTKPLRMNDQDFINLFFDGRIKLANPYRYNCEIPPLSYMKACDFCKFEEFDMSETPYPRADTPSSPNDTPSSPAGSEGVNFNPHNMAVLHYSAKGKPTKTGYRHKYADVFWRYYLMDPLNKSSRFWKRALQSCWGHLRRLIPENPLATLSKQPTNILPRGDRR